MKISEEQFKELYSEILPEKKVNQLITLLYTDDASVSQKLKSKLWRMNNLYYITDIEGKKVRFEMNLAQHKVYIALLKHHRLIILKSRQLGISTYFLVYFFDDIIFNENLTCGLMAQDNDTTEKLLRRAKFLWDNFKLKEAMNLRINSNNKKNIELTNGSIMYIATSFRSSTLQRLHVSELGKICNESPKKATELKTGTLQAIHKKSFVVFESTAEGDNMFKDEWDKAINNQGRELGNKDFAPIFFNWMYDDKFWSDIDREIPHDKIQYFKDLEDIWGSPIPKQKINAWIDEWDELGDYIYQEYPFTDEEAFMYRGSGNILNKHFTIHVRKKGMIKPNKEVFDQNLPVQAAMDVGVRSYNAIVLFQFHRDKIRIFDEYKNFNQPTSHYVEMLRALEHKYGKDIVNLILPHDANKYEQTSGQSILDLYNSHGFLTNHLERTNLMDGIESIRQQFEQGFEIAENCTYIIDCMHKYTLTWDKNKEIWSKDPRNDIWSHGADAVRYAVIGRMDYDMKFANENRKTGRGFSIS